MSSFSIASVIGVPFSLWISNFGGWHVPFLMLASFAVIVWPLVVFKFPSMSGHLSDGKQKRKITPAWGIFARVLNSLPQRLGILFMMLMMFGHFMIIPYLSQSLVANTGLAESQLPLVYLVGGVLSFFTSPMIGRWADRSGKVRIFTVIHLMALVWILIITNLPILPVYLTLGISGIFFILVTGRFVPAMAVINGLVEAKHRASYFSLLASCHQLAGSLATFISGHIVYFHLENKRLENYGIAGMISCLFGLMALHIMHKVATAQK
jgi:predicted MFS family arabinose efflux permease